MTTISDIAKKANVSKSTVSLVINNSGYVSGETREKVNRAIKELNYIPNGLARNLSLRTSHMVGVMVPDIANPFFAEFIKYVENELYIAGFKTMICNTSGCTTREQDYLDLLQRKFMDGLIVGQYELPQEAYLDLKCPIVSLDRLVGRNVPIVRSNHEHASKLISDEVIRNGCKKLAIFKGKTDANNSSNQRHILIQKYLKEAEIETITIETETPYNIDNTVKKLMDIGDIDGVVGADLYVMGCLKEAYKRKMNIPSDFCAIAYDGTFVTNASMIPVTAIMQPIDIMAKKSVDILKRLILGEEIQQLEYVIDVKMNYRGTTIAI